MVGLSNSLDAAPVWLADPVSGLPYRGGSLAPLPDGTNRSGTTSATAGTATTLAPANASRTSLTVQNISTGNIGVNETGGTAVIGNPGTYTIPAGGQFKTDTARAISVVGSAASQAYTATEK